MLDDLMDSLQQEGALESQGEFSLDLRGEALKMAQFQQQEPGLWLLKGVQAAVASGASEVCIRLSRKRFDLAFQPGPQAGQATLESEERWCRHLRMALTLALAAAPQSLGLSQGEEQLLGPPCPDPLDQAGVHLWIQRPKRSWWKFSDPDLAAVASGLARRCAFCPIPVRVDGRDMLYPAPELSPLVGAATPKVSFGESALAVRWLCECWAISERPASFSLYAPGQRSAGQINIAGSCLPGRSVAGFLSQDIVSSTARVDSTLHTQVFRAENVGLFLKHQAGPVLQSPWGNEIRAGAFSKLPEPNVLCLSFSLERISKYDHQVDNLVIAEVPPEQLVPQALNLARFEFPKPRCQYWLGLCSSGRARGGLFLIQDGVMLNPLTGWSQYPGTTAFLATSGQATDLSQLSPVHDEALDRLVEQARTREAELAQDARNLLMSVSECERLKVPLTTREHWRQLLF